LASDACLGDGERRPPHEAAPIEIEDAPTRDAIAFGKTRPHMSEYEMRCDRQFSRALNQLQKFRATRTQQVLQTKDSELNLEPNLNPI
jgi:hypothetical protein